MAPTFRKLITKRNILLASGVCVGLIGAYFIGKSLKNRSRRPTQRTRNKEAGTKAKRQAKATSGQIDYMADYFMQHPHVATGKFHGNADLRGSWEQLDTQLNSMGKNGKTKDVKSWKSAEAMNLLTVGDDEILNTIQTDTESLGERSLNNIQTDSQIKNVETAKHHCEIKELLWGVPINEDIIPQSPMIMEHDVNYTDATDGESLGEGSLNIIQNDSQIKNVETAKHHCEIIESQSGVPINEDIIPQSLMTVTQSSSKKRKAPQNTKRKIKRLGTQLQNARKDFATLAERQKSCMEIFAKVMQQIADIEKNRNECLRAFIEAGNSIEKAYFELMIVVKNYVEILKNKSDL